MRKAIYPGSFDPITNGHIDIVKRARKLFDEVHIAVAINPEKTPFFSYSDRVKQIKELFQKDSGIFVQEFSGLIIKHAENLGIYTVIRGLRAVSDFDYEFQFALTNQKLSDKIETVFLMTDAQHSFLSSRVVRQLSRFGGDISQMVPPTVERAIKEKTYE